MITSMTTINTVHLTVAALALAMLPGPALPAAAQAALPSTRASVQWEPCPSDAQPTKECALLRVPRRYSPAKGHISIALARLPATGDPQRRIGSLLWDAGGPGGASTAMIDSIADRLSPRVRERFDFVAFDPRGIGASQPALADCAGPWPIRPALDPTPDWRQVRRASARQLAQANQACIQANRRIARVMGTVNVARDLDRIRRAVGDDQLTFWATSYGTRIGYVYALRYPDRVRAMVMDGSIDPTTGYPGLAEVGGVSQDNALGFVKRRYPTIHHTVIRTARALTTEPVRLSHGGRFTRWDWLDLVGDVIPFQPSWQTIPRYAAAVRAARQSGPSGADGRTLLEQVIARPNSNQGGGFSIVNCLDYADWPTAGAQSGTVADNARRAPVLGGSLTTSYAIGCAGLRSARAGGIRPDPIPLVTTASQRRRLASVPVLLANATQDGATPMPWARRMQRVFDRPMIRYRSGQHVIWGAVRSQCVNRPIDRFVLRLRLPATSRTCPFVVAPDQ